VIRLKPAELWRWALTLIVLLSLVVTLATRFQAAPRTAMNVHSTAPQAASQHMNQDAVRWVVPLLQLATLLEPSFYPRKAPARPLLANVFHEESLYNRPPPAC
jgi:hypothetical protein